MHFEIKLRDESLLRAMDALGARAVFAQVRALNRSAVTTRTFMQRAVADDTNLGSRDVAKQMRVDEATQQRLTSRVIISGKRIPLADFKARQTRRGVSADTGGGRKVYPGTFLATMKSGHLGVFARRGKARLPIDERYGPSLPHVFQKHVPEGLARGEESLMKNLAHELDFALQQTST